MIGEDRYIVRRNSKDTIEICKGLVRYVEVYGGDDIVAVFYKGTKYDELRIPMEDVFDTYKFALERAIELSE